MACIENAYDLCKHFNISEDCEIKIHNFFNTHKDNFLKPCTWYFLRDKTTK